MTVSRVQTFSGNLEILLSKSSEKRARRREQFRKLGVTLSTMQPIVKIGDPDARDYQTGRKFGYEIRSIGNWVKVLL